MNKNVSMTERAGALAWVASSSRRALLGAALLSIGLFVSACSGCGNENEDPEDPCADVTCERGVCSQESGICINAEDCAGDEEQCLEGWTCNADDTCEVATEACNDTGADDCSRGTCSNGACINPDTCEEEADCLKDYLCGEDGTCEVDPCVANDVDCSEMGGGICEKGTGECVNKQVCSESTEAEDCVDGYKCYNQACVDEQEFCAQLDCERGVCSFDEKACINAEDCGGEDASCLDEYFCNEESSCQENLCDTDMVMCDRGVCERTSGACINPETCDAADDCLPMNLCVGNACVQEDLACGEEGCPGNQVCFYDEPQLDASCVENTEDGCTNAIDCTDARVCVAGECTAPSACEDDAYEPNGEGEDPTVYADAQIAGTVDANVCMGDVDIYTFDTEQDVDSVGQMLVELTYAPEDIGLGTLRVELLDEDGDLVVEGAAEDGRVELTENITIVNQGVYTVRVSDDGDVAGPGIDYELYVDVVDTTAITACESAPVLAIDTEESSNTVSGDSTSLTSSCGDTGGVVAEDIWVLDVTEESYLTITGTPDMTADISMSLRSGCLQNVSELPDACVNAGEAGGVEELNALVEPGTYYLIVQGPAENTGGSYTVSWSSEAVVCTSADNGCVDADTLQTCRPDGTGFETENCLQGCNEQLNECNRLDADLCTTAQVVDAGMGLQGQGVAWDSYRDDYDPGVAGCVPTSGMAGVPADGPDKTYQVEVPPNHGLSVGLTSEGNDASIYLVEDCQVAAQSCIAGANAGEGDDESLFWVNDTMNPRTVFVIADVAQAPMYENDSIIDISVDEIVCMAGASSCTTDPATGEPASQICNDQGTGYLMDLEVCAYGCDDAMGGTGECQGPPNDTCVGATPLTSGMTMSDVVLDDFSNTDELSSDDCVGFGTPGPDAIFTIEATAANDLIEVDVVSDGFDLAIWSSASCDTMAGTVGACIEGADENFGFGGDDEALAFLAPQPGTYYIVVTSFSSSASGDFDITATVTPAECDPATFMTTCQGGGIAICNNLAQLDTYACQGGACGTDVAGRCDNPTGEICLDANRLTGASGTFTANFDDTDFTNDIELPSGGAGSCYVGDASDGPTPSTRSSSTRATC